MVGGHSHTFLYNGPAPSREQARGPYPSYVTVNDTDKVVPVVQAFAYTKYMGHLRLNFDLDTGDLLSPVQGGVASVPLKSVKINLSHLPTLRIKRIEHRKWNRGCHGLHQLGQPVAPSFLLPVFNPSYPQGTILPVDNC